MALRSARAAGAGHGARVVTKRCQNFGAALGQQVLHADQSAARFSRCVRTRKSRKRTRTEKNGHRLVQWRASSERAFDAQDWAGLLEFTKTYDQELRKLRMGKAKKLLQSKEIKEKGTEFCNAVTFDLIGINRSSRSGQESVDSANKYLQELRDDVNKFLALESSIQVEGLTK